MAIIKREKLPNRKTAILIISSLVLVIGLIFSGVVLFSINSKPKESAENKGTVQETPILSGAPAATYTPSITSVPESNLSENDKLLRELNSIDTSISTIDSQIQDIKSINLDSDNQ